MKSAGLTLLLALLPLFILSQTQHIISIAGDWVFRPQYELEHQAQNFPGPKHDTPSSRWQTIDIETDPIIFWGLQPTERLSDLMPVEELPHDRFTVELFVKDHVNQPVGALLSLKSQFKTDLPGWVVGYYDHKIIFQMKTTAGEAASLETRIGRGFKRYFYHIVATYDGSNMSLYVNGALQSSKKVEGEVYRADKSELEAAAYLQNEPFMDLGNLLQSARIYDDALTKSEIQSRYAGLQGQVERGILIPNQFHFIAGPYLHLATQNSMNILWETDRAAKARISYGKSIPLDQEININEAEGIQEITIENLEAETPYYYEITAIDTEGQEIKSGILTFKTAVKDSSAYSFAIFGDTEARAHINDRVAKLIWDERPNFMIDLGDLTDGGQEAHKFEWNYEYFLGLTQLASRVPIFPVPGNGESDLYWYNRYHKLPEPEDYYSFHFGNAQFFMLNSNEKDEFKPGAEQYEWLKEQLANSTAKWKFVAHHHGVFTSDENDYGDTWKGQTSNLGDLKIREIVPIYEEYGVDVVFFGHLHTYERSWPIKDMEVNQENGVVYLLSGGAGGNLEDFAPTRSFFTSKLYRGHHYGRIDIHQGTLFFKMYDINGALKDYMEIRK